MGPNDLFIFDKGGQRNAKSWMGLPYEGPVVDFKENDPETHQPQLNFHCHVKQLRMDDEDDRSRYEDVQQKVFKGEAQVTVNKQEYDPEIRTWRVLLAWTEMVYTPPNVGMQHGQ